MNFMKCLLKNPKILHKQFIKKSFFFSYLFQGQKSKPSHHYFESLESSSSGLDDNSYHSRLSHTNT